MITFVVTPAARLRKKERFGIGTTSGLVVLDNKEDIVASKLDSIITNFVFVYNFSMIGAAYAFLFIEVILSCCLFLGIMNTLKYRPLITIQKHF